MIRYYNPDDFNDHTICISFNHKGYKGEIVFEIGGNCKGLDVINNAETFIEECCESDIEKLISNDCDFLFNEEDETFCLSLTNDEGKKIEFSHINESTVKELIVSVEIIACYAE